VEDIGNLDKKIDTVRSDLEKSLDDTKTELNSNIDQLRTDLTVRLDDHAAQLKIINQKLIPTVLNWLEFPGHCLDQNDKHFDSFWFEKKLQICKDVCAGLSYCSGVGTNTEDHCSLELEPGHNS